MFILFVHYIVLLIVFVYFVLTVSSLFVIYGEQFLTWAVVVWLSW